ncbi:LPD38 domain-containing protein [Rhodopirellula baltica]
MPDQPKRLKQFGQKKRREDDGSNWRERDSLTQSELIEALEFISKPAGQPVKQLHNAVPETISAKDLPSRGGWRSKAEYSADPSAIDDAIERHELLQQALKARRRHGEPDYDKTDAITIDELRADLDRMNRQDVQQVRQDEIRAEVDEAMNNPDTPWRQNAYFKKGWAGGASAASAIVGAGATVGEGLSRLVGADETADSIRDFSDDMNRYSDAVNQVTEESFKDTAIPDWIERAGQSALNTAPLAMSTGGVGGARAMIATFGAEAYDNALTEAKDAGLDEDAQRAYAAKMAAVEVGVTSTFQRFAPGMEKLFTKGGAEPFKKGFKQAVKQTAISTGQEIPEELMVELLQASVRASDVDPTAMDSDQIAQTAFDTTTATIATVMFGGAVQYPAKRLAKGQDAQPSNQRRIVAQSSQTPERQPQPTDVDDTNQRINRTLELTDEQRQQIVMDVADTVGPDATEETVTEGVNRLGYFPELLPVADMLQQRQAAPESPPPEQASTEAQSPPAPETIAQEPEQDVTGDMQPAVDEELISNRYRQLVAEFDESPISTPTGAKIAAELAEIEDAHPELVERIEIELEDGYAVARHVDKEDVVKRDTLSYGGLQGSTFVNEAGVTETAEQAEPESRTAAVRQIEQLASEHEAEAQRGSDTPEPVAFTEGLKAQSIRSYAQRVESGVDPAEAVDLGKTEAREAIAKHNARKPNDESWQRWHGAADEAIKTAHRTMQRAGSEQAVSPVNSAPSAERAGQFSLSSRDRDSEQQPESPAEQQPRRLKQIGSKRPGVTTDPDSNQPVQSEPAPSIAEQPRRLKQIGSKRLGASTDESPVEPVPGKRLKQIGQRKQQSPLTDDQAIEQATAAVAQPAATRADERSMMQNVAAIADQSNLTPNELWRQVYAEASPTDIEAELATEPEPADNIEPSTPRTKRKPSLKTHKGIGNAYADGHISGEEAIQALDAIESQPATSSPAQEQQPTDISGDAAPGQRVKKQIGSKRRKPTGEDRSIVPLVSANQPAKIKRNGFTDRASTKQGGKLIRRLQRDIETGERRVGARSIVDYMLDGFASSIFVTKSQTTGKHPALFRHSGAVVFSRSGSWQINLHEGGHAMDLMLRDRFPAWFEAMEPELRAFVKEGRSDDGSRAAEFASSMEPEEAIAEIVRLYIVDESQVPPTLLRSFERLVEAASPEAMATLNDTKLAYEIHAGRSLHDRRVADRNDKPKSQEASQGAIDTAWTMLTHVVGKSPILHRLRRRVYQRISGESSAAQFDPTGVVGSVAGWADRAHRRRQKIADEVLASLDEGTSNIDTAYQNQLRRQAVKMRAIGGSVQNEGVRLYLHGDGFNALAIDPQTNQELLDQLEAAGFLLPETLAKHGEGQQFHEKSYSQIKAMIPDSEWQDFQQAFLDRAAIERHRKAGHQMPGIYEGLSIDEIQAENDRAFADHPKWNDAADEIQVFMDQLLLISVVSGNLTVDDAIKVKTKWEHYAPLQRQMDDVEGIGGSSGTEPRFGIHTARGSMREYQDLDTSVYARVSKAIDGYHDNALLKSVVDYTQKVSTDKRIDYATRKDIERMMVPLKMDTLPSAQVSEAEQHEIVSDALNRMQLEVMGQRTKGLTNEQVRQRLQSLGGTIADPDSIHIAMPGKPLFRRKAPNVQNVVTMWEGGTRRYYMVSDPVMFSLFTSTSGAKGAVRFFSRMATGMTEPWKRAYTNSFKFLVRNLVRDPPTAAFLSKDGMGMIPGYYTASAMVGRLIGNEYSMEARDGAELMVKSLDATTRDKHKTRVQYARDVLLEGLVVPGFGSLSVADKVSALPGVAMSTVMKPVDLFNFVTGTRWLAEQTESLAREGAYIRARKRGKSQADAHALYDKISGNFGQRQADKAAADVIRAAGFLNPSLQVIYQMGEAVTEASPSQRLKLNAARAGYLSALGSVAAATNYLLIHSLFGDDEEELQAVLRNMREREETERLSNMAVLGVVRLPFDYGPAGSVMSFSYNATEDHLLGSRVDGTQRAKELLKRAAELPGFDEVIPPHAKVNYELWNNWSFYRDREIVPRYLEKNYADNPSLQFNWYTPDLYRDIGAGLNVSPMKVQYAVRGLTTAIVDDTVKFFDKANKDGWEIKDLPPIAGLTTWDATGHRSRSVNAVMDLGDAYDATTQVLEQDNRLSQSDRETLIEKRRGLQLAKAVSDHIGSLADEVSDEQRRSEPDHDRIESLSDEMTRIASEFYHSGAVDGDVLAEHFAKQGETLLPYKKGRTWKTGHGQPEPPPRPAMSRESNPSLWESYDRSMGKYERRVESYLSDREQAEEFTGVYLDWLGKNQGHRAVDSAIGDVLRSDDFRELINGRGRPQYDRSKYKRASDWRDDVDAWNKARAAAIELRRNHYRRP